MDLYDPKIVCLWCGRPYSKHNDKEDPLAIPRVPCLLLKSGFIPKETLKEKP